MARSQFGGTLADSVTNTAGDVQAAVQVTFWNAPTGGAQFTDLLEIDGITAITGGIVNTDTDGSIRRFYGPDAVTTMWAQAGAGIRRLMRPSDETVAASKANLKAVAAFTPLKAALADTTARSCAVQVLGDSTGNEAAEWVYEFAQAVAVDYPAWTVQHRLWADATQQYGAATTLQTGTAGERYLDCSTGTKTRRMDSSVSPAITGPLDVRVRVRLADWTPAATVYTIGKNQGVDGSRGWYFGVNTVGYLTLSSTSDGTAAGLVTKSSTAAAPFLDGATGWIRFTYTPDNGAAGYDVKFYTSTDGATWTQLGTTVTTAGVRTIFNPAAVGYELGGQSSAIGVSTMRVYEAEIRDGIDGPSVVPALPDLWPPYSSEAAQVVGAPVLTFVNGSHPGGNIAYLGESARLPKMTPDYGQLVTFLSDSHNEGVSMGAQWTSLYDTWRGNVETQVPGSPVVVLTQNPQTTAATWYREHSKRRLDLVGYARVKGLGVIDTYQAFLARPDWATTLMADSVHPNAAGQDLWRDTVKAAFDAT